MFAYERTTFIEKIIDPKKTTKSFSYAKNDMKILQVKLHVVLNQLPYITNTPKTPIVETTRRLCNRNTQRIAQYSSSSSSAELLKLASFPFNFNPDRRLELRTRSYLEK